MEEKELKKLFKFFKKEGILLADKDLLGEVEIPLIDEEYIMDRILDEGALEY